MDQWVGKVAVVTGATTGIGSAICVELVKAGMIVCGLAKRQDKVEVGFFGLIFSNNSLPLLYSKTF